MRLSTGLRTQWSLTVAPLYFILRHVAVGARDAGTGVDALAPSLKFRMASFHHGSAGVLVHPLFNSILLFESCDLRELNTVGPGKVRRFSGPRK